MLRSVCGSRRSDTAPVTEKTEQGQSIGRRIPGALGRCIRTDAMGWPIYSIRIWPQEQPPTAMVVECEEYPAHDLTEFEVVIVFPLLVQARWRLISYQQPESPPLTKLISTKLGEYFLIW